MEKFILRMENKVNHLVDHSENEYVVTSEFQECSLDDTLKRIEEFLRGCGYYFEGDLDIV